MFKPKYDVLVYGGLYDEWPRSLDVLVNIYAGHGQEELVVSFYGSYNSQPTGEKSLWIRAVVCYLAI